VGKALLLWVLGALAVGVAVLAAAVLAWSGARLAGDPVALARVHVQPLGGTLESARAFAPDGSEIPLQVNGDQIAPVGRVVPGERVTVDVVVRRPGWLGWALGSTRRVRLSLRAPIATVANRWLVVQPGSDVVLHYDQPVAAAQVDGRDRNGSYSSTVSLGARPDSGSATVRVAARAWEWLGPPQTVTWFPKADSVLADPPAGGHLQPLEPIRLTYAKPVGNVRPALSPHVAGSWSRPDTHTLVFTPSHALPFNTAVRAAGISWTVPPVSFMRLQQLLAEAGYLPVTWIGPRVARTPRAELSAAVAPPRGHFAWRYPNTPHELQALWRPGQPNQVTRGAVMMFQHDHNLAVDAVAGPKVWSALIADTIAGKRRNGGYSYVYVHRAVPQLLALWHNGHVVLTSPGNTGVPQAPTALGTFPVFEHIPVGTMSGRNPNGTHYNDPGIRWISYFHGGEALHAFTRASFGTPQSLGCVELPLAEAARVWPYTPIGTLVTIED
jgi:lipoprotein-anchoring transpeptidase ErfK/SrfK